ncbi:MAG TPA: clostripain-related cysteine peptidase [Methanocorpusculum sp.]|nr:clostripain-related cysteine peptidase [Methanocorpusculum sp.]
MGSLEVADALYPYGTYLLASEEIVPGEGYDYNAFAALSASPGMSSRDLGKTLIAYFLDQPSPAKTLSLARLSEVPSVVAALNVFGEKLTEVLDDPDSLAVLGSIYQDTQGFGSPTGDAAQDMMDLYEFADSIRQQTGEDTELYAAVGGLRAALDRYIVVAGDDGHFSAANGVSIAAPVEALISEIPYAISFDKSGWYTYLSTYMDYAGTTAQPHAAYTTAESARSIQVTDSTGAAWVTANYLYLNTDGQYLIVGDVPLKEIWEPADSSVWKTVPTGVYEEPDWDGSWFVFRNTDGTTIPATLTYKGPAVIDNRSHVIYTIEGNLTRTVHKNTVTAPSILTAVIDTENRSVSALSVTKNLTVSGIPDPTSGETQQFVPAIFLFRNCRYTMRTRMKSW